MQVNKTSFYRKNKLQVSYNSPVILTFVIISSIAIILSSMTDGKSNYYLFSVYRVSYKDILGYLRIFTHVLGHANKEHFSGNIIFILLLGPILEEKYGSRNILVLILITAFVTGIYNIIFNPSTMLLGASGIVYMLMILASIVDVEDGKIPLTFILAFFMLISTNVVVEDDVARFAHILGGVCGAAAGYMLNIRKKGVRHGRN